MTVVICSVCGRRIPVRNKFEAEGECPECGADEALVEEDSYDPEPSELICTDCRARFDGGPIGSGPADEDHEGRYTVEDPCPFCSSEEQRGELVPLEDFKAPKAQPETAVARAAAHKLWSEHGSQIPVNVAAIAEVAGLTVVVGSFGHAGRLSEGTTIEVPQSDPLVRQRFTIAHELGHAILRHKVPENRLEIEADAFAAELLIPRSQLREAVNEGLGFRAIAGRFQASRQATLHALSAAHLLRTVAGR
jgi:hypothetical protein